MIPFRFLSVAEEEMAAASAFYDEAAGGLGVDFLNAIQQTIDIIRRQPSIGKIQRGSLRSFPMARFPFNIIYVLHKEEVMIVAMAHQSRRPGYWNNRV